MILATPSTNCMVTYIALVTGLSDKDDTGPNHGFGGAQSSGDDDSGEERDAAVAAAVAQKAKARGGSATAALQRAEEAGAANARGERGLGLTSAGRQNSGRHSGSSSQGRR
jgi:hypothetical protein